jgi:hypothetical protein
MLARSYLRASTNEQNRPRMAMAPSGGCAAAANLIFARGLTLLTRKVQVLAEFNPCFDWIADNGGDSLSWIPKKRRYRVF